MSDHPTEYRSVKIFKRLGVPEEEQVSHEDMNQIAEAIRKKPGSTVLC